MDLTKKITLIAKQPERSKKTMQLVLCLSTIAALSSMSSKAANTDDEDGAKGLFREQMEKPSENLNTGLKYWIELNRKGKATSVTNKEQFLSGDKIRFHVKANIDGYAYILLKSGSRGEQSVLFPERSTGEDNHVERGKDYVLPQDGFLTFDQYPGTEKVTLLLSRNSVDAQAYLSKPQDQPTIIASAQDGSKDLVPAKILVAYNAPRLIASNTGNLTEEKSEPVIIRNKAISLKFRKKQRSVNDVMIASKPRQKAKPSQPKPAETEIAQRTEIAQQTNVAPLPEKRSEDNGVVTIVYKNPQGVLYVDMMLNHR